MYCICRADYTIYTVYGIVYYIIHHTISGHSIQYTLYLYNTIYNNKKYT